MHFPGKADRSTPPALVDEICATDEADLARVLEQHLVWEKPSGDLWHWVPLLNTFDELFERLIGRYGLDLPHPKLREIAQDDEHLLVACLRFSAMLLEHCARKDIYGSAERIYQLLNAASVDVRLAAFEVAYRLGARYSHHGYSKRFQAPKDVRAHMLAMAKAYPPPVPAGFQQKRPEQQRTPVSVETPGSAALQTTPPQPQKPSHYSLVDTLDQRKKYPSKWKSLTFQYFCAEPTDAKKKKKNTDRTEDGVATFHLSEEQVRKLSLAQIYDRAAETLPRDTWSAFAMAALTAKAFNTRLYDLMALRLKLLRIKCLAIACTVFSYSADHTLSNLFEVEPALFAQLADLISPEHFTFVSNDVFYTALKTIECIALKGVWSSELVRTLGGNVSHGLMYQLLRYINKKVRNEDDDTFERGYLAFFIILGIFVDSHTLMPRLASGGLLTELMTFLNVRTKYRWTCSAAVNDIAIFLTTSPEHITDFANNGGFALLINTIDYEVNFALENPDFGGGAPRDTETLYHITLRQVNYLRNLLKLVSQLILSDAGDRLRNLFDSSILASMNKIISNPNIFGPFVVSATLDAVSHIIHNEPTAFSILKEAKVIDTILFNYNRLFLPSAELILSLAEILGAISLNKEGLQAVSDSGCLHTFFKSFYDLKTAKELLRTELHSCIGCSIDELGRHYPSLRPVIMKEFKLLVETFPAYANEMLTPITFHKSTKYGSFYRNPQEPVVKTEPGQLEIERWDTMEASILVDNVYGFISGFLQESGQWGKECVKEIEFSSWEKFLTMPNTPYDYCISIGSLKLMAILKYLDDEDREYGFPVMIKLLDNILRSPRMTDYINYTGLEPYYLKFDDDPQEANEVLKELNVLNNILHGITEIYLNPASMINEITLNFINYIGSSPDLIDFLRKIMQRSIKEEIKIRSSLPNDVIEPTAPVLDTEGVPIPVFFKEPTIGPETETFTSCKHKNTLALRTLAYYFQHHIALIFSCISRSCIHRRQDYFSDTWRTNAVLATKKLALALSDLFDGREQFESLERSNYDLVSVNLILSVCLSKDRGKEVISTSLLLSFYVTTHLIENIVNSTVTIFNELPDFSKETLAEVKNADYVRNTPASIKVNFVLQALSFLSKIVSPAYIIRLPFTTLFYNKEYCSSESLITDGILTQGSLQCMRLIVETVGTRSKLLKTGDYSLFARLSPQIIDLLFVIIRYVWSVEPVNDFYPLDETKMTPASGEVDFLVEKLSVDSNTARKILQVAKSVHNITSLSYEGDDSDWEKYRDILEGTDYETRFKYEPVHTDAGTMLEKMRSDEGDTFFTSTMFEIAAFTTKPISQVILINKLDDEVFTSTLFTQIEKLAANKNPETLFQLGNTVRLFDKYVCREPFMTSNKLHDVRRLAFGKFLEFFIDELEKNPDLGDSDYFAAGLRCIEPVFSQTPPTLLENVDPYIPNLQDFSYLKPRIASAVVLLKPGTNIEAAFELCRFGYLLAKEEEYKQAVICSPLIKAIINQMKYFVTTDKKQEYKTLQDSLILLIRTCFEDAAIVKRIISSEITKQFRRQPGSSKELRRLIDDTRFILGRDPGLYIETASRMLRIENFDGKIQSGDKVFLISDQEGTKETDDVEMEVASEPKDKFNPAGLMHFLLSELMQVSKEDWVSTPESAETKKKPEQPKKKKEPNFEALMKNPKFGYLCFLLQTITELLGSYKAAKLEFITYSKKDVALEGQNKPRSTSLNFFIHQLIPSHLLTDIAEIEYQRRDAVSSLSKLSLLALVSTAVLEDDKEPDPKKEDPDMAVVRNFLVSIISKILKESLPGSGDIAHTYSKIHDVFDLCACLLSSKFRELCFPLLNKNATKADQYYIASAFIATQLPNQIASVIANLDLNFPDVSKVSKVGLKPLSSLAKIKSSNAELFEANAPNEKDDEDIEDDEEKDETPDLFRNSTLGMYDIDLEDEEEEDFYDDGNHLEVMMSGSDLGSDISDEDSAASSDIDSALEDAENDLMEEDMEEGDFEGYDSDDSENQIEIIDELDIHSASEDNGTEAEEFYGFDNEYEDEDEEGDLMEVEDEEDEEFYDDAELDDWLEMFEESEAGNRGEVEGLLADRFRNDHDDAAFDLHSQEDNNGATEEESIFESDVEEEENAEDVGSRRTREFITSFVDALRPLGQQNFSSLFDGLVRRNSHHRDDGLLRGSIQIGNSRGNDVVFPSFDTAFEVILNDKKGNANKNNFDLMFIRSTVERWRDAFPFFFNLFEMKFFERARARIVESIHDASYEIFKKKAEEKERIRKQKEEKILKKREELQKKREEEARQREAEEANNPTAPRSPVMVWIGDREVDISGTDIDPEFFEALPEDMREEVFTQHVRERRAQASTSGADVREIDPDFMDALPELIRDMIQQESLGGRYSIDGFRYGAFDDDNVDELEEGSEIEEPDGWHPIDLIGESTRADTSTTTEPKKPKKTTFSTPLVDRAAVASLVRLLFAPRPITQREYVYHTLLHVCNNLQTRAEVMSILIAILHDGLVSQRALERVFTQVSAKAHLVKPSLKGSTNALPLGATPVSVGIQITEAIFFLVEKYTALRLFLLTEHENAYITKRHHKHRPREATEDRYPINLLLKLLENPLLHEEVFVDLVANVLHFATRPLLILRDKNKQAPPGFLTKFIPDKNLRLVVSILSFNECSNSTFRRAISAMQHLSLLKNAQTVFSLELSQKSSELGVRIIKDLKALTTSLLENPDADLHDNKAINDFTAPSSDQSKLLRILTALDYMFETNNKKDDSEVKDEKEISLLTGLYKDLQLGTLWDALSECLRVLEENHNLSNTATVLLPLIEALMVICKHSKVKELQIKDGMKYETKKIDFKNEPIESLFFSFTDEHKKILNQMVRSNPNLMSGPFSMLVRNPRVLEFDNKRNYFDRQLHDSSESGNRLSVSIRRDQVFLDSYRALFFKSVEEFKKARLEINFKGESGVDAGGVTREWYQVLSRQMFNPDYALFTAVASDETTFHPNRTSYINPEHLSFFKFIGRIIGKAIFDGSFLDCHFSRAVYKKILDRPVSLKDMENLDLEYFKSLMWMLENDITDVITEDFSVEADDYGEHKIIDLVENGRNIPVTEQNKHEYVRLVVEYRLQKSVLEQMSNFITGFHEIIPRDLVAIFDEQELELLISGLPDIDVQDWKNNTTYVNYSPSLEQIQWFWRAVKSFDNEERAKLLQFATGTSKVPLNGFKELRGANGGCKFSIHRDYGSTERLPSSHTCFNQIDLPAYASYEMLRGSLLLAITEGHEGFGMA